MPENLGIFYFMHDNGSIYTTTITRGFYKLHEIEFVAWPFYFPGLYPIEFVRSAMNDHIHSKSEI